MISAGSVRKAGHDDAIALVRQCDPTGFGFRKNPYDASACQVVTGSLESCSSENFPNHFALSSKSVSVCG
jgi:hypothetical protein